MPALHLHLYAGDICDWLINIKRIVIGHDYKVDPLTISQKILVIEALVIRDIFFKLIGHRQKRGDEVMPMKGNQCKKILVASQYILDTLNGFRFFFQGQKGNATLLPLLYTLFFYCLFFRLRIKYSRTVFTCLDL